MKNMIIHSVILVFLAFWIYQVFNLVQDDAAATQSFDPHEVLGIPQSVGFNSAEVKKAYRKLAVQYHPDKVAQEDREEAQIKFQLIVKAYEILTDPKKHDNWQKYGDPDGSKAYKAMEIALPSFLLK